MNLDTFRSIKSSLAPYAFMVLSCVGAIANAQTSSTCNALVSSNNQLYLASRTGDVLTEFITDSLPKDSIALSPNGDKVAYISSSDPNSFTVADVHGRSVHTLVPLSTRATFVAVSWDTNNVLNVRSHISRENDLFHFYSVPDAFSPPLEKTAYSVIGQACAASGMKENHPVCISENLIVVKKNILESQDPLSPSNTTVIATLAVPNGSSVTSQSTPSFQARVLSIADGITLQIGFPDGTWSQSRVALGETMPVSLEDGIYGFIPSSLDAKKGVVTVSVVKSKVSRNVFDPAITWANSSQVAAIERGSNGTQFVLLNSHGEAQPIRAGLNLQEPIVSMNYDSPSLVVFRTPNRFAILPISSVDEKASAMTLGTITSLPTTLPVALKSGSVTAEVAGWSCH